MDEFAGLGPYRAIRSYERSDATATLDDVRRAAFDDAVRVTNFDALSSLVEEGYDRVNDRIKSTLGEALDNPYRAGAFQTLIGQHVPWTPEAAIETWNRRIGELRAKAPDALPWDDLIQTPTREAYATMRETRARQEEVSIRRGFVEPRNLGAVGSVPVLGSALALGANVVRDPAGIAHQFAGSLYGQFHSPVDAAANLLPLGAGRAAWSLIKNAVANAAANATIQAALSVPKQLDYEKAGLPHGWRVWLQEVEGAAATGFMLDLGIRGPARAVVSRFGRDTPADTLLSRHTERGGLLHSVPERAKPPAIDPETYRKAQDGDLAAAREIAEKTGALDNPELKAAFETLETVGKLDAEALLELEKMGVARPDGFRVLADAIEGRVPTVPEPPRPAAEPLMRDEGQAIVRGRGTELEALMAEAGPELAAGHPRLAQFIHDAVEAGVPRYVTMVQEALDRVHGRRTRAEEARGLVAKVRDIARENPERFAAEIAFQTASSPLEVAGAIRAFPDLVDTNVRLDSDQVRFGRAIAGLEESAYDAAMRGAVPPEVAALVGERVPPAHQARVIDDLARAAPDTITEAKALIDELVPETRHDPVPLDGGAGLDEPTGAAARAQIETLRQENGRAYESAIAPIEARNALESRVETLRGEIAQLEQAQSASATRFVDPVTGLEVSGAEIASIKDMWSFVQDMRRVRPPQSLVDFLHSRGGLQDEGRDVSAIIDGPRGRPGLINSRGLSLDDAALMAWEAGFFESFDRPPIVEFLEAIRRDINGDRVTRGIDAEALDDLRAAREMESELDQLGIGAARTEADFDAHFRPREGGEGARGGEEAARRPQIEAGGVGLDAKRAELADAEARLNDLKTRLLAAASGPPEGARETSGPLPDAAVRAAIEAEIRAMLPPDVAVRVVDRISTVGDFDPLGVFDPTAATVNPLGHIETLGQAVLIAARGSRDDMLAIGRHEVIHALREINLFLDEEWASLVDHANRHKVDERMEVFDEHGMLVRGIPYYERAYRADLEADGFTGADLETRLSEYLNQERVAWLAETWRRRETSLPAPVVALLDRALRVLEAVQRALYNLGIRSLEDYVARADDRAAMRVAERVMSGEIGRRDASEADVGGARYALRHDAAIGRSMRRDLDALGYYSQALEAAKGWKQAKGTPAQALAHLKASGVKDAEIEATGLKAFLEGKKSVSREELVQHVEGNRVTLNESRYTRDDPAAPLRERYTNMENRMTALEGRADAGGIRGYIADFRAGRLERRMDALEAEIERVAGSARTTRWQQWSLDADNPTYRETVLHMPERGERFDVNDTELNHLVNERDRMESEIGGDVSNASPAQLAAYDDLTARIGQHRAAMSRNQEENFRYGHFPEPNVVGHMMTSITTHMGRRVYTIDQIQSDWGQRLRSVPDADRVGADRARIQKELATWRAIREDLQKPADEVAQFEQMPYGYDRPLRDNAEELAPRLIEERLGADDWGYRDRGEYLQMIPSRIEMLEAELEMTVAHVPRHGFVNTTDQWVSTTLRRAIRQAAEADAEHIAIPTGRTVLSYNPGDDAGMAVFYDTIVPKNLRNLLRRLDPDVPAPERIATLDSPSGRTNLGQGFTLFELTPAVKQRVIDEGQPLFALKGPRRNAEGFELKLPFRERWGDPRFDPADRARALDRLKEIQGISPMRASWAELNQAFDDVHSITANLLYYRPDTDLDVMKSRIGGDIGMYEFERQYGAGEIRHRRSIFSAEDLPSEVHDFAREGKVALDRLLGSRRSGIRDLAGDERTPDPRLKGQKDPANVGDKLRSGFYFKSARALADVPDALFPQGGWAVINHLRQAGVRKAEVDHFELAEKLGNQKPVTREAFQEAINDRVFDFRRKTSWLNPEWSPRDYELGGTRAFTGPRIPGRGTYFERLVAFPKQLRGGDTFVPGMFQSPHWEEMHKGTWGSWRGSEREVPGYGKTIVGEEGQSDFMQGAIGHGDDWTGRRPRLSTEDYLALKKERPKFEAVDRHAERVFELAMAHVPYEQRIKLRDALIPHRIADDASPAAWDEALASARKWINVEDRFEREPSRVLADERLLEELVALKKSSPRFFEPGAFEKYMRTEENFTPESPLDDNWVRTMVRDLMLLAAQRKADSIAIATSATTGRIQANTYSSAAHFYDSQLKPALERELRTVTGDATVKLEEITLPKAQGAPRNEKGFTVWAAKLPDGAVAKIQDEGLPLFALRRGDKKPPDLSRIDADAARLFELLKKEVADEASARQSAGSGMGERVRQQGEDIAGGRSVPAGAARGGGVASGHPRRAISRDLFAGAYDAFTRGRDDLTHDAITARRVAQGFTVEAWHGTRSSNIETVDPFISDFGFHVALQAPHAANARMGFPTSRFDRMWYAWKRFIGSPVDQARVGANVIPLYINASKPLRMPDIGDWSDAYNWVLGLRRMPRTREVKELLAFATRWDKERGVKYGPHEFSQAVAAEMERLGFDSVIYRNRYEGIGSDSLFVWRPEQVRSAYDTFDERAAGAPQIDAGKRQLEEEFRPLFNEVLRVTGLSEHPLFARRGNRGELTDSRMQHVDRATEREPEPPINSEMAFVDRLSQIKDLIGACRA